MTEATENVEDLNLGVIGNCVLGALINRRARIVWCCYPRFDGDPIFCSLMTANRGPDAAGFLDVEIRGHGDSEQRYVRNTAILETALTDSEGQTIRIIDFAPRFKQYERVFRPQMLVRRIEPQSGACQVRIRIRPLFDYGGMAPSVTTGSNHIRYVSQSSAVRVTTDAPISHVAEERWFILDKPLTLILGPDERVTSSPSRLGQSFYERTKDYWVEWARYLSVPFEWQDVVIRAAITLKLCSFEETGGIIAAMTTSIPEAPNSGRNWDYRYCWLRDAYYAVYALNRLGATRTMEDYIRYISNVAALEPHSPLKPVYGIVPGVPMPERVAPALSGYRDMGPVRIGNLAELQTQNDGYGSVVLAAAQMFFDRRLPNPGDLNLYHRLEHLGERAAQAAFEPDAGLWEYRGRTRVHTYSSVMCWAACDRLAKIGQVLGLAERSSHWRGQASQIRDRILERSWNPALNSLVESFDGDQLDASLLVLHEIGFILPSDPRFVATLGAIERQLLRGRRVFRYVASDDFGAPTTGFTVCAFWYIDALIAVGRREEAREHFEDLVAHRNHLGLLSEDIDPVSGELWGNYPQTYSMVGLILSAMRLSKSWREVFRSDL